MLFMDVFFEDLEHGNERFANIIKNPRFEIRYDIGFVRLFNVHRLLTTIRSFFNFLVVDGCYIIVFIRRVVIRIKGNSHFFKDMRPVIEGHAETR